MVPSANQPAPTPENSTRTASAASLTSSAKMANAFARPTVKSITVQAARHALTVKTTTGSRRLVIPLAHQEPTTRSLDEERVFVVDLDQRHARRSVALSIRKKLDIPENAASPARRLTHTENALNHLLSQRLTTRRRGTSPTFSSLIRCCSVLADTSEWTPMPMVISARAHSLLALSKARLRETTNASTPSPTFKAVVAAQAWVRARTVPSRRAPSGWVASRVNARSTRVPRASSSSMALALSSNPHGGEQVRKGRQTRYNR